MLLSSVFHFSASRTILSLLINPFNVPPAYQFNLLPITACLLLPHNILVVRETIVHPSKEYFSNYIFASHMTTLHVLCVSETFRQDWVYEVLWMAKECHIFGYFIF